MAKKFKIESLGKHKKIIDRDAEIKASLKAYKKAQKDQLKNGGPGPVADYDVMAIVNEYDDQFEIIPEDVVEVVPEVVP